MESVVKLWLCKQKKEPVFESWEEEEYQPGIHVLPRGLANNRLTDAKSLVHSGMDPLGGCTPLALARGGCRGGANFHIKYLNIK